MKKKALFLCLVVALILCQFSTSYAKTSEGLAQESDIVPMWTLIRSVTNGLTINSSGQATMTSYISTYDGVDRVRITASLQRRENNAWVTVKSWNQENDGTLGIWSKQWYVNKGYEYRLLTYFNAYKGASQESTYLVTAPKPYK